MTMTTATVWTPDGPRHFKPGREWLADVDLKAEPGELPWVGWEGSMKKHSFEDKAPLPEEVPSEKWEKRNHLSNALGNAAHEAARLEDAFDYQYRYNQDLVEQLAESNARCVKANDELRRASETTTGLRKEAVRWAQQLSESEKEGAHLKGQLADSLTRCDNLTITYEATRDIANALAAKLEAAQYNANALAVKLGVLALIGWSLFLAALLIWLKFK